MWVETAGYFVTDLFGCCMLELIPECRGRRDKYTKGRGAAPAQLGQLESRWRTKARK